MLDFIESEIYWDANMHYMTAWAALSSHPKLDIKTSLKGLNKVFASAKNAVPYMEFTESGQTDDDTKRYVARWKALDDAGLLDNKD